MDVPEIDGIVYIKKEDSGNQSMVNQYKKCFITDVNEYDMYGELLNE